jgi:hypothetical protein
VLPVLSVLGFLLSHHSLGGSAYLLASFGVFFFLIVAIGSYARGTLRELPELRTANEKSVSIAEPFDRVCNAIPQVVARNHWKLFKADGQGHFTAKIGMSVHTFGSTIIIDVTRGDSGSTNIHVLCGTSSLYGQGHNEKMITKFYRELDKTLETTKT